MHRYPLNYSDIIFYGIAILLFGYSLYNARKGRIVFREYPDYKYVLKRQDHPIAFWIMCLLYLAFSVMIVLGIWDGHHHAL